MNDFKRVNACRDVHMPRIKRVSKRPWAAARPCDLTFATHVR